jgi:MoxR-like ATPase
MGTPERRQEIQTAQAAHALMHGSQLLNNERVRHGMALSLIARRHMLLVGPPGVAKTLAAQELFDALDLPADKKHAISGYKAAGEEILIGYLNPGALEAGRYEFLPGETLLNVVVCYVDEIEKLARVTQQILLQPMQSQRFSRAGLKMTLPLQVVFAGGNGEPEDPAVRDRFAIQIAIGFDQAHFERLVTWADRGGLLNLQEPGSISWEAIEELQDRARALRFSEDATGLLAEIGREFRVTPRTVSEAGVPLAKAQAALEGASRVNMEHVATVAPFFVNRTGKLTPEVFDQAEEKFGAAKRNAAYRVEYQRVVEMVEKAVQPLEELLESGGPKATAGRIVEALREIKNAAAKVPSPDDYQAPWDEKYKKLLVTLGNWQQAGLRKLGL